MVNPAIMVQLRAEENFNEHTVLSQFARAMHGPKLIHFIMRIQSQRQQEGKGAVHGGKLISMKLKGVAWI
jgi:hypothetical protein